MLVGLERAGEPLRLGRTSAWFCKSLPVIGLGTSSPRCLHQFRLCAGISGQSRSPVLWRSDLIGTQRLLHEHAVRIRPVGAERPAFTVAEAPIQPDRLGLAMPRLESDDADRRLASPGFQIPQNRRAKVPARASGATNIRLISAEPSPPMTIAPHPTTEPSADLATRKCTAGSFSSRTSSMCTPSAGYGLCACASDVASNRATSGASGSPFWMTYSIRRLVGLLGLCAESPSGWSYGFEASCVFEINHFQNYLICVTVAWPTSRTVVVKSSTLCTLTAIGGSHFKTTLRVSVSFHFPTQYECQWALRM